MSVRLNTALQPAQFSKFSQPRGSGLVTRTCRAQLRVVAAGSNGSSSPSSTASKGFSGSKTSAANGDAESASARLNKLRENSAALRELLQKRAAGASVTTSNGSSAASTQKSSAAVVSTPTKAGSLAESFSATTTAARSMVPVTFYLKFHVDYGQHIVLVGSMPELGNWVLAVCLMS